MSVLNPRLYGRIKKIFGDVKIANQGSHLVYHTGYNPLLGKDKLIIDQRGETYCVNCPFCHSIPGVRPDTKHRLWINHRWGVGLPFDSSSKLWSLAICYNEDCLSEPKNLEHLKNLIYGGITNRRVENSIISIPDSQSNPIEEFELPDKITPINKVGVDSKAYQYLTYRKFDLDYLWDFFNIYYAELPPINFPKAFERIIIPIYVDGKLLGWQARFAGIPPEGVLRYWTKCIPNGISNALYGYDIIPEDTDTVVLVEGPTDVWRFGPGAVALLGSSLSLNQVNLLKRKNIRNVLIMLDSDMKDKNNIIKIEKKLRNKFNVDKIDLPSGKDPADLDRQTLYELLG